MIYIFFTVFLFPQISSYGYQDYKIIDRFGVKTPLYEQLFYSLQNKGSKLYWTIYNDLVNEIDTRDEYSWFKFVKSDEKHVYTMYNCKGDFSGKFKIEYLNDDDILMVNQDRYGEGYMYDEIDREKPVRRAFWSEGGDRIYEGNNGARWIFKLHPDYYLNADLNNVDYKLPIKDLVKSNGRTIDLLTTTIDNDYETPLVHKIGIGSSLNFETITTVSDELKTISKSFYRLSIKLKFDNSLNFGVASAKYEVGINNELGWDWTTETNHLDSNARKNSFEKKFELQDDITILPFDKVRIQYSVDMIKDVDVDFKAKVFYSGTGPKVKGERKLNKDVIRILLTKYGYDSDLYVENDYKLSTVMECNVKGSTWLMTFLNVTSLKKKKAQYAYTKMHEIKGIE